MKTNTLNERCPDGAFGTLYGSMMLENEQDIMSCVFCGNPMPYRKVAHQKVYMPCGCSKSQDVILRRKIAAAKERGPVLHVGAERRYALTPREIVAVLSGLPVGGTDREQLECWNNGHDLPIKLTAAIQETCLEGLLEAAEMYRREAQNCMKKCLSTELVDRILKNYPDLPSLLVF